LQGTIRFSADSTGTALQLKPADFRTALYNTLGTWLVCAFPVLEPITLGNFGLSRTALGLASRGHRGRS